MAFGNAIREEASVTVVNATHYPALGIPYVDPRGQRVVIAIAKATFEVNRSDKLVPAQEASPVRVADMPWDEMRVNSSVKYPSDVCCAKRGVDVIVVGAAISPQPVIRMDVLVRVGPLEAPLVVHGERFFVKSARGMGIGPAARFETMPVVYERAYGGATTDSRRVEERNPSGVGIAHRIEDLEDTPAPQIEHPAFPYHGPADEPVPMGYGATLPHWLPRRNYAGTFDDLWRQTRMPLIPADYDARFENVAHPALQLDGIVEPSAEISVLGMSKEGLFRCETPNLNLMFHGIRNDSRTKVKPLVDTILIEPASNRVEFVYRAVFPMGRGRTSLREIRVDIDD